MALIVEDGTGLTDAESYVSAADCDTYHGKFGNSTWTGDTTTLKEPALRRATRYIDGWYRLRWKGVKRARDQALEWPRVEAQDGSGYYLDSDTVPAAVINATCEAALLELVTPGVLQASLERGGAVKSETVDVITTVYADGASTRTKYPVIDDLLNGLLFASGTIRLVR